MAADPAQGIIRSFQRVPFYNDEPKFSQYTVSFQQQWPYDPTRDSGADASGTHLERDVALLKALCEGIERHCLAAYNPEDFTLAKASDLDCRSLPLPNVAAFTQLQLKRPSFKAFRFNSQSNLKWIQGHDCLLDECAMVPAQLVYVPYEYKDEPAIRLPISTGAACSTDLVSALCRGILEVIERDAYMRWFLSSQREAVIVNLNAAANAQLTRLLEIYERYRLELIILSLPSDIPIPVMMAIIVDRTGIGPFLTMGLKCHPDPVEAILGAVAEAQQMRPWLRDQLILQPQPSQKKVNPKTISTGLARALYWASPSRSVDLTQLLAGTRSEIPPPLFSEPQPTSWNDLLEELKSHLVRAGMSLYYVDVTTPTVRELGFVVLKVLIPEAQPLYLDERFPYLGGTRLHSDQAKPPQLPHPFV